MRPRPPTNSGSARGGLENAGTVPPPLPAGSRELPLDEVWALAQLRERYLRTRLIGWPPVLEIEQELADLRAAYDGRKPSDSVMVLNSMGREDADRLIQMISSARTK